MAERVAAIRPADRWSLDEIEPLHGVTMLQHVSALLPATGRGPIHHGGEPLPDEPPRDPSKLQWGAAMDGLASLRFGEGSGSVEPLEATAAALAALREAPPTTRTVHALADRLARLHGPHAVDGLISAVRTTRGLQRDRLAVLGRWLCTNGTQRGQVKAGMALLGISGDQRDIALVSKLGILEQFSLYAVVAMKNLLEYPDQAILDLAKQVDGWGRVLAIHRLNGSTDPEVRSWLLRGGYRNEVMIEEVAFIAATTGGLADALQGPVDDELLTCAGELLTALAVGGPAEDMTSYDDADVALGAFLSHIDSAPATLARLGRLHTLERYLSEWAVGKPPLSEDRRAEYAAQLTAILARPEWRDLVEHALASDDIRDVRAGVGLAPRFDIDSRLVVRDWVGHRAPHDGYLWQALLREADRDDVLELLDLANDILPFADLPRGPERNFGLGLEYAANHCFESILQRLRAFPGDGWSAIAIGLDSRVTRTRNTALKALESWPRDAWPPEAHDVLSRQMWREPDDKVRERIRTLLGDETGD